MESSIDNSFNFTYPRRQIKKDWFLLNQTPLTSTILTFFMSEGILTGMADGHLFTTKAYSGGGGGHSTSKIPSTLVKSGKVFYNDNVVNNPDYTSMKEIDKHHMSGQGKNRKKVFDSYVQRGGPLPCGHYLITQLQHHNGFGSKVPSLIPTRLWDRNVKELNHRNGILIHGSGEKGSDGCIVIPDKSKLKDLLRYISATKGGHLEVYENSNMVKHEFNMKGIERNSSNNISSIA